MNLKPLKLFSIIYCLTYVFANDDCKTPAECYLQATAMLNKAREEYRQATDRITELVQKLSADTNQKLTEVSSQINNYTNEMRSGFSNVDNRFNAVSSEITSKSIKNCEFKNCKIGNWDGNGCRCPGNKRIISGGCTIPNPPYDIQMSNYADSQAWACSHPNSGGSTVDINILCCEIPLY